MKASLITYLSPKTVTVTFICHPQIKVALRKVNCFCSYPTSPINHEGRLNRQLNAITNHSPLHLFLLIMINLRKTSFYRKKMRRMFRDLGSQIGSITKLLWNYTSCLQFIMYCPKLAHTHKILLL